MTTTIHGMYRTQTSVETLPSGHSIVTATRGTDTYRVHVRIGHVRLTADQAAQAIRGSLQYSAARGEIFDLRAACESAEVGQLSSACCWLTPLPAFVAVEQSHMS